MSEILDEIGLQIEKLYTQLGRPPTQAEVRVARKGGSNSTINAALKLWRSKYRAKALPSYLVEAAVNLHEASMQDLANQTKDIEERANQRVAQADALSREVEKDAKARSMADRAALKALEIRLAETEKALRQAEVRYHKEQITTAELQSRVDDRNREVHTLKEELKRAQERNDDRYSKALQLLNNPKALGVPLYAAIRADSQFADQNLSAIDRDELPFRVCVVDSVSGAYRFQGGPGGQYRVQDLDIYTRVSGGLVCLSSNPEPWQCPADIGNFKPDNPQRIEGFQKRGMV
jgi:rubrerythrin